MKKIIVAAISVSALLTGCSSNQQKAAISPSYVHLSEHPTIYIDDAVVREFLTAWASAGQSHTQDGKVPDLDAILALAPPQPNVPVFPVGSKRVGNNLCINASPGGDGASYQHVMIVPNGPIEVLSGDC